MGDVGFLQVEDFADDLHKRWLATHTLLSRLFFLALNKVLIELRRPHVVADNAPVEVWYVLPDRAFMQLANAVPNVMTEFCEAA